MADDKKLEELVLTRLIRLNAVVQGLVTGALLGIAIFVATNWLILKGGPAGPEGQPVVGPHLSLLRQFFFGYRVTFLGSLIGLVYGFATGFGIGYVVARIYNWIVDLREKKPQSHA
ncbi:MAG TPA: hypothetical protein VIE89_29305 [Candidatus Binatia bacterium]|jgi:hypothetical protein